MEELTFHWSGGKDSAFALYLLQKSRKFQVVKLLTNFSSTTGRVSMHGVRKDLMVMQAESIGIPLSEFSYLADQYDEKMGEKFGEIKQNGINHIGYGDIFLEDLKKYRDDQLSEYGLQGVYPLWKKNTSTLVKEFIDLGFKTIVVCVNGNLLDSSFVGRTLDHKFLEDLPSNVDPCGENGEFHTFVYDGPIFKYPLKVVKGETILKTYPNPIVPDDEIKFWFCDIKLKEQ